MAINWQQAIEILTAHGLLQDVRGTVDGDFSAVSYDSRKVTPGTLFFAKGNFQPAFLTSALELGASAYVTEVEYAEGGQTPRLLVTNVQKAMAVLGAAFYNNPENDLFIIAFTGTKGKTTGAYFTHEILQASTDGKTALFSTIDRILGPDDHFKSDLSTPESLDLFHDMRKAVDYGMTHLVMEVSSQAYKKSRVYGLTFDIGIFLNISPDHIGPAEHPTFADYLEHKLMLFDNSRRVIINGETDYLADVYGAALRHHSTDEVYVYARETASVDAPVDVLFTGQADLHDSKMHVTTHSNKADVLAITGDYTLNVPGDYNESNAASVLIATALAGATQPAMVQGLREVTVPGRMESFDTTAHGTVYVDYAHNYVSMKALMKFLHTQHPAGKVIVVLGAPGNKAESRRAGFGQALSEQADVVWLTADDPQFEDPRAIADEIAATTDTQKVEVHYEMDRPTAIKQAIMMSTTKDVVAVAGKGLDPYQKINGVDTPYIGDMQVARDAVAELEN